MFKLIVITSVVFMELISLGQGRLIKIQKCCPVDQVIDVNQMKCRDSGAAKWSPRYYPDSENGNGNDNEDGDEINYEIVTKIPKCPGGRGVHILPLKDLDRHSVHAAKFRLLKSGRLVGKHANGNWIDIPSTSCIDGIMNFAEPDDSSVFTGEEIDQAIITCPIIDQEK